MDMLQNVHANQNCCQVIQLRNHPACYLLSELGYILVPLAIPFLGAVSALEFAQ